MNNISTKISFRILHRYLGFFLAGIMFVYALSGLVLIYRSTDFLKVEKQIVKQLEPGIGADDLSSVLKKRNLKVTSIKGDILYFKEGTYNSTSGIANYTSKELPFVLKKLTKLHKASTKDSLYWLNLFFGVSLLFFVVSAFWMFKPKTKNFKKGIVVSIIGVIFTLLLLFF